MHHNERTSSPSMQWIGIYPTDISYLKLNCTKFTVADERRMRSLLKRDYIKNELFLRNELLILDRIKFKSGLQDLNNFIFNFIPQKVHLNSIVLE